MKRPVVLFLIVLAFILMVLAFTECGESEQAGETSRTSRSPTCDEQTAHLIGRLYYLTNPINEQQSPEAIKAFVSSNRQLLSDGSSLVNCARRVGKQLISRSILSFNREDADDAYGQALNMGATMEQARQVGSSVSQGSIEAMMIGEELLWLAEVVPEAAAGDWNSYINTGSQVRLQIRQIWPLYQTMLDMDPSMKAILEQTMQQFQPWIEYQVAALVLLMTD